MTLFEHHSTNKSARYLEDWESKLELKIVHQEDMVVPSHLRQAYTEAFLHAAHEIIPQMPEDKKEGYVKLLAEVNDETANGVAYLFPTLTLIVARKL